MDKVTVRRAELLSALTANRTAHQAIFEEAVKGYKAQAERLLTQHLKAVRNGRMQQVAVYMDVPVNHTKDYDRVIKMVEMSVPDEVQLTGRDFASYVMDDWTWKQQFLTTNSTYSVTAAAALDTE